MKLRVRQYWVLNGIETTPTFRVALYCRLGSWRLSRVHKGKFEPGAEFRRASCDDSQKSVFMESRGHAAEAYCLWQSAYSFGIVETEPPTRPLAKIVTPLEFPGRFQLSARPLLSLCQRRRAQRPTLSYSHFPPPFLKVTPPIICHIPQALPRPKTPLTSSKMSSSLRTTRTPSPRPSLPRTYSQGLMTPPNFILWLALEGSSTT